MATRSRCTSLAVLVVIWCISVLLPGIAHSQQRPGTVAGPYEVRLEKSVLLHMRDGVRLSTDLYFPVGAPEPLPVILIRLPYNKNRYVRLRQPRSDAYFFAGHGYVVAVQDMRGRFESEGEYVVGRANRDDGYDAVEWLAKQPWSNGRVGTYGCSYLGENQLQLAATRHPNHAAAIPQAAGGGYDGTFRTFLFMDGGAFEMASGLSWFATAGRKTFTRPPSTLSDEEYRAALQTMNTAPPLPPVNLQEAFWELPVIDILESRGVSPTDYEDFVRHMPGDPYWKTLNYVDQADRFDIPALHVNSWYDLGTRETMDVFNLFRENAESARGRDNQFVIMSPTTHCASEFVRAPVMVGARDLGDATLEYYRIYLDWFDHWLKGIDNGITDMPKIQYYLMGANEWRSAGTWPLPNTELTPFYLHSAGHATTRLGDGTLSTTAPVDEAPDRYTYDPADPVPSVGGPICCISAQDAPAGSFDQSEVELRNDVLVYTSDALEEGIEVTGSMEAVLYVSSSAKDTDFTVKLIDVYPDGRAFNVQETILRARYREGFDRQVFMEPGEVYQLRIDLHATANYFGPGHRVRIEVSSSNFPRFDRNLNTGGNNYDESSWVVAENTIHHSRDYPSRVMLPIVRR
ncbi:MAG: CocE/NonD family hydrolase [Gemmatimonadales bacterium]|nr:CocE/NonD family hydrolase [Gemmatimonadales bacterium]NIN13280.1 CocE/NonD family hydrolase [Gemmatimonadales bacterium]NIQ99741.1 CocE/NonD family hydrolase [Gemmatimonadales bacterium]NIS64238.1 CocE/NonD family hydrolase [Gemmatimonadales bacterium]